MTLDETCAALGARARETSGGVRSLGEYVEAAWSIFGHPEFKIVIEVWLAARNDEDLRVELEPVAKQNSAPILKQRSAHRSRHRW